MTPSCFHSFDIKLAEKYGVNEAIIIHHFCHWIRINTKLDRNFHEGRYWTYQTIDEIAANFPYMTKDGVRNILEKLCDGKSRFSKKDGLEFEPVLIAGNFNKTNYDKTIWYAFSDTFTTPCGANTTSNGGIDTNPVVKPPQGSGETTRPIPDPIPDTKTKHKKEEAPLPLSFGNHVKLSKQSYAELSLNYSEEQVLNMISKINDYIDAKGEKPYKDYAAAIRNWIRRDIEQKGPKGTIQANDSKESLANECVKRVILARERNKIHQIPTKGPDYIEFYFGHNTIQIRFTDGGFREQCINCLRKMGIDFSGL